MTAFVVSRALDSEPVARELGNWRTSSRSGPTYQALADGLRMESTENSAAASKLVRARIAVGPGGSWLGRARSRAMPMNLAGR